MDPRQEAVARIDGALARARRGRLEASACASLIELVPLVPGRLRAVAEALAAQRSAAAVDALLQLPPSVPGVVEGVFQALAHGAARTRLDGSDCPHFFALDFRHSRAHDFASLLARARSVSGPGFEHLDVSGRAAYRVAMWEGRGTFAGRVAAASHDLQWLHRRLSKLRGTRLWLNGWCFASDGAFGPAIQVHLVRAWLGWAGRQTQTRI